MCLPPSSCPFVGVLNPDPECAHRRQIAVGTAEVWVSGPTPHWPITIYFSEAKREALTGAERPRKGLNEPRDSRLPS